ncbi:MAG: cyanoglobin [Yoonia sp.]|nr:cyanoglobin [Yoonia sp.]
METLIDHLGGEDAVFRLVNHFYDLMETDPNAADIHRLHFRGHGVDHTRVQQVDFMIGFLGGRQHYRETHGHMDVREIHAHVPIRQADADAWLATWDKALVDCGFAGDKVDQLRRAVHRVAQILINEVPDWRIGETA